jgi:peptidoglycan/LPS O-acetylase OafA/YrhL
VVRAEAPSFRLPLGRFVRRRAMRILPPYYAALALSLLALSTTPLAQRGSGTIWDDSFPAFERGPIASHLLLVHNWFPAWTNRINGPLWSVASEWQIYFFLPLLLLPAWRRLGPWGALAVAAACSYAPLLISKPAASAANPWYLLLFAFGMLAAFASASSARRATRLPWSYLSAAAWLGCLALSSARPSWWFSSKPLTDPLVGLATALLLVHLTGQASRVGKARGRLLALLESRPLVALGNFSYSLYLTHLPVVAACYFALLPLGLPRVGLTLLLLLVGGLASLGFAYAFHRLCERPFMQRR